MAEDKQQELYGCTLRGVAARVSYTLGDLDEQTGRTKGRYDSRFLCAMVADAVRVLAELKREDFVEVVSFPIESGQCVQTLPEECEAFREFICFRNKSNGEQYPVFEGAFNDLRKLTMVPQATQNCHQLDMLTSFRAGFSPNSSRVYAISPTLPEDAEFCADALCSVVGPLVDDIDRELPQVVKPLIPALTSLSSYMILLADTGDPTALAQAQSHLAALTQMLQITTARLAAAQFQAAQNNGS